jgi:prepilin-type N-terminal cleavage/methylation domain-containing protein
MRPAYKSIMLLCGRIVFTQSAWVRRHRSRAAAFTLTEVLVASTILALIAASVIWGLNQLNYYASVSRLYTAAQTLAQNQIDLILTKAPFNPATSQYPTPNVLQIGTYYSDPTTPNTRMSVMMT